MMSPRNYLKLLLEKWKKFEMLVVDFSQKKWWALPVIVNVTVLCLSALFLGLFLALNWKCILNPELSEGYSCGTPFGDGGDKFGFGLTFAQVMIFWLTVFNIMQAVIISKNSRNAQKNVLSVFTVIALIELVFLGRISLCGSIIVCILIDMPFNSRNMPVVIPLTILIVSVILAFMKKRIALPLCFLSLTATAVYALQSFSICLYWD